MKSIKFKIFTLILIVISFYSCEKDIITDLKYDSDAQNRRAALELIEITDPQDTLVHLDTLVTPNVIVTSNNLVSFNEVTSRNKSLASIKQFAQNNSYINPLLKYIFYF